LLYYYRAFKESFFLFFGENGILILGSMGVYLPAGRQGSVGYPSSPPAGGFGEAGSASSLANRIFKMGV